MYICMICKLENKNFKCYEEIVILNVFCVKWKLDLIVVFYCICRERIGEGDRERERRKREVRKRRERGVNLVEINKFFNCIRL